MNNPASSAAHTESNKGSPMVLVVSELAAESTALATVLQRGQHSAVVVNSLQAAASEAAGREFAVIVCALASVGSVQLATAGDLRKQLPNAATPIIFLTPAGSNHADIMRALGAGITDCVDQPVDDFVLQAKVKMYVDMARSKQRLREFEAQGSGLLTDSLTGLPNRVLYADRADQAMRQASRSGGRVAVAVMDLDQIHDVKETLGPMSGDELLRQIALRLTGALRRSDTVARIGDTAFGAVLACDTRDGVETVTARLDRVMSDPFVVGGHRITLGGGIGVAMFPEHGREPRVLVDRARAVMAIAKQNSLGHLLYDPIEHADEDKADATAEMSSEELMRVTA